MTIFAAFILAYRVLLGALMLVVFWKGTGQMKRTAIVLALVYSLQLVLAAYLWPLWYWSAAVAVLDLAAIRPVTWHPAGKMQSFIGWTFLLQASAHAGRVIVELNNEIPDMNSYWWLTTGLAFMQLFLIGGWLINDYLGHRRHTPDRMGHPKGAPAAVASVQK